MNRGPSLVCIAAFTFVSLCAQLSYAAAAADANKTVAERLARAQGELDRVSQRLEKLEKQVNSLSLDARSLAAQWQEDIRQVREAIRAATLWLVGLKWDQVKDALASAEKLQRRVADLEEKARSSGSSD